MNNPTLLAELQRLFDCHQYSPGQAFDALIGLRREGVTIEHIKAALTGLTPANATTPIPLEPTQTNGAPNARTTKDPGAFTDTTIADFGKYRGDKFVDIPSSYFQWLYDNAPRDPRMKQYCITRLGIKTTTQTEFNNPVIQPKPETENDIPF